jgi:hypothetical protein
VVVGGAIGDCVAVSVGGAGDNVVAGEVAEVGASEEGTTGLFVASGLVVSPPGSAALGSFDPPMGMICPNDCAATDVATSANTKRTSVDLFSNIFWLCVCKCMCCFLWLSLYCR